MQPNEELFGSGIGDKRNEASRAESVFHVPQVPSFLRGNILFLTGRHLGVRQRGKIDRAHPFDSRPLDALEVTRASEPVRLLLDLAEGSDGLGGGVRQSQVVRLAIKVASVSVVRGVCLVCSDVIGVEVASAIEARRSDRWRGENAAVVKIAVAAGRWCSELGENETRARTSAITSAAVLRPFPSP